MLHESIKQRSRGLAAMELPLLLFAVWGIFISIPLAHGGIGLSSDAMNHQIYLGWVANAARFDIDLLAASHQSYQYPYLYWPVYKLALGGASGIQAGMVLATLDLLLVPPVWMLTRACLPGKDGFDVLMRLLAVLFAFMCSVLLLLVDSTSNDILAAVPFVWAVAFALAPQDEARGRWLTADYSILLSGALAGVAAACKLSNGPLALALPVLWLFAGDTWCTKLGLIVKGSMAAVAAFLLAYGYWGWQLWTHFGNPVYPFYESVFEPVRRLLGWHA